MYLILFYHLNKSRKKIIQQENLNLTLVGGEPSPSSPLLGGAEGGMPRPLKKKEQKILKATCQREITTLQNMNFILPTLWGGGPPPLSSSFGLSRGGVGPAPQRNYITSKQKK